MILAVANFVLAALVLVTIIGLLTWAIRTSGRPDRLAAHDLRVGKYDANPDRLRVRSPYRWRAEGHQDGIRRYRSTIEA